MIEVADEGPGMATDDADRVFERFWRSDPSRTRASGGAGLGLAIVAAIADAHGGRAEVESEPGQGATFRVHLPCTSRCPRRLPVRSGRRRTATCRRPTSRSRHPGRRGRAPTSPLADVTRGTSVASHAVQQADDELAEVVAGEQAHQRFGRAVEAVEHVRRGA